MYTITRLGRKFGLSRSTLLYYDHIGLLCPSGRSPAGYRLYSEKDAGRLEQVCMYRKAGLSLEDIRKILDAPETDLARVLEVRLEELNGEIAMLREQQRVILGLLKSGRLRDRIGVMNVGTWVSLLEASGFSDEDMARWHRNFEQTAPEKHQAFLEFLCLSEEDIRAIREEARGAVFNDQSTARHSSESWNPS